MESISKKKVFLIFLYFILVHIAVALTTQYLVLGNSSANIYDKVAVTALITFVSIVLWFQNFALVYILRKTKNKKMIIEMYFIFQIATWIAISLVFNTLVYGIFYYKTDIYMTPKQSIGPLLFLADYLICCLVSKTFAAMLPNNIMPQRDEVETDSPQ